MASADAVLRALKAMPGAATPTLAPQGGSSYYGRYSPLVQQLDQEHGYARTYGPGFLPRSERTFTAGAFGPFSPILPVPVDEPADGADQPDARLWQYATGWNLPVGQPGTEGIKLADFGTLKTFADLYSVARACIELRKNEITGLEWEIIPTKDASKDYHGSDRQWRDFGARRGQAMKFFSKPDPDYNSFRTFMTALLEEVFVFDALSLLIRPKRGKGLKRGILGSDLDCLELISGPTMRPLVGMHGEIPRPPDPAYQQYLFGVPRSDYMTMITERDIEEGGLTNAEVNAWTTDQFLYLPLVPRRWTPYGFPPVERALIPVMSGLQKQAYQLDYFREGTIPAVYVSPGDVNMTPNQIRELQDALNAFAGDPAWHHKVIVLPPGSKVDPQKAVDVADQFDEIVMTQVCQAFDVNPMELGILPKVAATASPSQIKQIAQGQASVHERLSTKPLLKYLADIFDSILHNVLHQYDMKFTFEGLQEDAEQGILTDLLIKQVQSGLRSVDEARDQLELQPWGLDSTSGPVVFTAAGPIPFGMPPVAGTPGQVQGGAQDATKRPPAASPAPLQQAGRQGAPAAPTPGHAAASAANQRAGRAPSVSAPATGSVSASKMSVPAIESELDMLVRHLNKGRQISTWQARHLPAHTMAVISEDLAKGLSPEQCADIAKTILLGSSEYEWLPKAGARRNAPSDGPWESLILEAFGQAIDDAAYLIRRWWSGEVALTRSSLIDQVRDIVYARLWPALQDLWAQAWRENDETAGGYYEAWEASYGRTILEAVAGSRLQQLDGAIDAAVRSGGGPDQVIDELRRLLDANNRAAMIAVTETGRAGTHAAIARYRAQGTTFKEWWTANDVRVCATCRRAQAEGAIPLDSLFSNGLMGPPAHPNCRCTLVPAVTHGVTLKKATLSKAKANYRPAEGKRACGNCSMIRMNPPDFESFSCTLVKGSIDPKAVCDHWDAAKASKVGPAPEQDIHPGEQDIKCGRGHTHHGEYGGAGLMIRHKGSDGKLRYLLQKRSPWENDPGTWSLPGGALLQGETVEQGAFREAQEEMGNLPPMVSVHHHVTDDHDGWTWTTVVCDTPETFAPSVADAETPFETDGWGWFTQDEISKLPLHPGFAESWQSVIRTRKSTELGKCVTRRVNLDGQQYWETSDIERDYPVAAGGGGFQHMPHDVQDIQHGRASGSRGGGTAGHYDDASLVRARPNAEPWTGNDGAWPDRRGVPPQKGPIPQGYMGGRWPQGGQGTGQAGMWQPVASAPRGTGAGNGSIHRKAEKRYITEAMARVRAQLGENFPPEALDWVSQAEWLGPAVIPLDDIDFRDMKSWSAYREHDRVRHFEKLIEDDEKMNPPVLIRVPGKKRLRVVDGHHRALAYRNLGRPVTAWVGDIRAGLRQEAEETHSSQENQGASEENE